MLLASAFGIAGIGIIFYFFDKWVLTPALKARTQKPAIEMGTVVYVPSHLLDDNTMEMKRIK